jgi:tetratricopeptide (TPR) repeat protein/transcriptional regulator with XRE-family HTH domain
VLSLLLSNLSFSGSTEGMMKMDAPKVQPRTKLIEARKQRKLSQQQLAERIGTNYVNVSRWERGITRPGPYFQRKLSHLFGKTEEELDLALTGEAAVTLTNSFASQPSTLDTASPPQPVASSSVPVTNAGESIYDAAIPLPPPVQLVGRESELAELRQHLRASDSVAMTALHGLPGVGKTTLAIALARDEEVRAHFRDGILWAGLGPAPDISSILSHWSLLLGVATPEMTGEGDHEALALQVHRAIGTRRMLLVIDDAWELEDALIFKVGGPNCAHLVTTRFPGIASAFAPGATSVIHELDEIESMVLLRMLAPQVMERESQKVRELALAAGGLPLALTLLGNYLRLQSYSGQARRIDAALARLSDAEARLHLSEPRGPTERHTSLSKDRPISLQAVIDVTCQQLNAPEKATLYALSVFPPKPGHFSEDAALLVANCTLAMLDKLIDMGLLEYTDTKHYRLHQTIADYARAALQDDTTPYERLISYAIDLVEKHRKDYEILEPEYDTIIAALEAAHTLGKIAQLMRCTYAFIPYLRSRGLYEQAEKQLQRAFEGSESLRDDDGKSHALLYLGEIAQKRGNYEQANAYLQDGLRLARQLENPERISAMLAVLGWITWRRGEYTRAETYLQEGLTLARKIENTELICDTLNTLGSVTDSRGEYDTCKVYMEEALALAREIGDREKICTLLNDMGATATQQGNDALAKAYLEEGLLIARQIGHHEWVCLVLVNLGEVATQQDDNEQAEKYFQEGLELARRIGYIEWTSILLINLGSIARKQGNYSQADKYLPEGLELARQIGRPRITSVALFEYGNLFLSLNQMEKAEEKFRETLKLTPEGDQELTALAQYGLARVAAGRGNKDQAKKLGTASVLALNEMGHRKAQEIRFWLDAIN